MPRNNVKYNIVIAKKIFQDAGCRLLEEEYINTNTKMKYICQCGNMSEIRLSNFIIGVRCKKCAIKKSQEASRHSYEYVYNLFKRNGCTLLETEYQNNSTKMRYRCSCGNLSEISLGNFRKGKRCRECGNAKLRLENNPNWNPNRTHDQRVAERKTREYYTWRLGIFQRDSFSCRLCGDSKGGNLVAHHLNSYDNYPEDRYSVINGLTLCEKCHKKFHFYFGYGDNTRDQFELFVKFHRKVVEEVLPK